MDEIKELRNQLTSLPQHSLPEEKKKAILRHLAGSEEEQNRKKRIAPLLSSIGIAVILLMLFLSQSGNPLHWNVGQQHQLADYGNVFSAPPYELIGVEGKVGILGPAHFVAEDQRRVAKLMLFFWGTPALADEPFKVEATNAQGERITLSEGFLSKPLSEEDAHALTTFAPFPKEGDWQVSFYVGTELFEEFTVDVLPPFPQTETYTLTDSPMEMKPGVETEVFIEKHNDGKGEISVEVRTSKGELVSTQIFQRDGEAVHAPTAKKLLFYHGTLSFPEKGEWFLVIDGEKTGIFQN